MGQPESLRTSLGIRRAKALTRRLHDEPIDQLDRQPERAIAGSVKGYDSCYARYGNSLVGFQLNGGAPSAHYSSSGVRVSNWRMRKRTSSSDSRACAVVNAS